MWVRRDAPDHVARVYVLDAALHADAPEVVLDGVPQEGSDIAILDVARCVALRRLRHGVLTRSLRDNDHGVASAFQPFPQFGEETRKAKRDLGNKTEVHLAVGQDRIGNARFEIGATLRSKPAAGLRGSQVGARSGPASSKFLENSG